MSLVESQVYGPVKRVARQIAKPPLVQDSEKAREKIRTAFERDIRPLVVEVAKLVRAGQSADARAMIGQLQVRAVTTAGLDNFRVSTNGMEPGVSAFIHATWKALLPIGRKRVTMHMKQEWLRLANE